MEGFFEGVDLGVLNGKDLGVLIAAGVEFNEYADLGVAFGFDLLTEDDFGVVAKIDFGEDFEVSFPFGVVIGVGDAILILGVCFFADGVEDPFQTGVAFSL